MRIRKHNLGTLFVLMLTAVLVLPVASSLRVKTVEAGAQDRSRRDGPEKIKKPKLGSPHKVQGAAPSNDNCANAIAVNACPFTDTKDTTGAADEVGEPQSTCTVQASSVWYTLPSSANFRTVSVETCSSDFDTAIMVWQVATATPCNFANFVAIACNDDFCGDGLQSTVNFTAQPNTVYKIQIGGFDGETGSLTTNIECNELLCPPVVINGTLGSGDPAFTGPQTSGNVVGRLNRNGISSTCAVPKACLIFDPANNRAYDAYSIPNQSGEHQCVSVTLSEGDKETCNLQSNAYLGVFNPASICTNYLADPGLSTGVPPTSTNMTFIVPSGQTLTVVVMTTNPGETGCAYTLTILGDLCQQFDFCVQDDHTPSRFILINSTTGAYEYHDCSKGVVITGTGVVSISFCKIQLTDAGPNPKKPDRSVSVLVNPCTMRGDATVRKPLSSSTITLGDADVTNNNCVCP